MDILLLITTFLSGIIIGGGIIFKLRVRVIKDSNDLKKEMQSIFGNLSREALEQNQTTFFAVAKNQFENIIKQSESNLEGKRKLIDSTLIDMKGKLDLLTSTTNNLNGQIKFSQENILKLSDTTSLLREVLSSSQKRGIWGEKMVEDILNFMGLIKGINYLKQDTTSKGRPDFTFMLPMSKQLNMDVKFPLANYEIFIASKSEPEKVAAKKRFLKDVREHIKSIEKRDYINEYTVDFTMVFIPNESIFYFINQEDAHIIDFALSKKIILCSPITLYAVLSLIRQAVSNFSMEQKAGDVQKLVGEFKNQWSKFIDKMDKLGNSLISVQNHYDELSTTRTKQLEKPIDKILELQLGQVEEKPEIKNMAS